MYTSTLMLITVTKCDATVYRGQLFIFSPRPSITALCQFARQMLEEASAPLDQKAQFSCLWSTSSPF
jgi:hypothetical protein